MGYMVVDDRRSGGSVVECDTFQCPHCQRHVIRDLRGPAGRTKQRPYCSKCGKLTCNQYPCNVRCDPTKQRIDRALSRQGMLRSMGL